MSRLLGLNPAWYADLEKRDDELTSTLTIFKAMELASILGVTLQELTGEAPVARERIALMELPGRIVAHAKREGISVDQLAEQVGWELQEFLEKPVQMAAEFPIRFFQALGDVLGINWLALAPDQDAT